MADRTLTITNPSVVTNDTLVGYNNYSDKDGQLGVTMTPAEGTSGKVITLTDGLTHQVTSKPVGEDNGEFVGVVSNQVTVDLAVTEKKLVLWKSPDTTQLYVQTGQEISMPHTAPWKVTVWLKRNTGVGVDILAMIRSEEDGTVFLRRLADGTIRSEIHGAESRFNNESASDDLLQHKYELSWTPGDTSVKLSIDDAAAELPTLGSAPCTAAVVINQFSDISTTSEVEKFIIETDGVIHTFDVNEGSGLTTTSDTGVVWDINSIGGDVSWVNANVWVDAD